MSEFVYLTAGTRISFRFFRTKPTAVAGAQMKLGATEIAGEGVIRNVWADDPEGETNVRFNVEQEDGTFVVVPRGGVIGFVEEDQ